ncbi:MAG: amino acid ABC transporter substrate-binding protein [Thermodesulfovibrionales bacterium]|nr:amino acid ABC transporter substrate-binding protein [Thermodesulfovibrionales bacterium]
MSYFFIAFVIIFSLFFSVKSSITSTDDSIRIGVTLSLTGKFSVMGNEQRNGYKIWEKNVNERGGILGKKVKVTIYDDGGDTETAKQIYERMIVKEKMDFLFGPYSSPITHAVLPITERFDYPLIISGAGASSIWEKGYKNAIGVYTPSDRVAQGFLELLVKNNIKKVAILSADDPHSRDVAKGALSFAKKFDMDVIMFESFKKDTRDLTSLAIKVRNSGAEALLVGGHLNEAIDMRLALKKINYYPKAYFASVGAALDEYYKSLKEDANLTFSSSLWTEKAGFSGAKKFYEDYLKTFNKPPAYHAALAYAGGQVLEEAIRRKGTLDRKKIREALFNMDTITIIGRFGIDHTGRQIRQHGFITQWQKGKKEIVWPDQLATANPIF